MSREQVCVTGGAGFIGSHLVDSLVDRGYEVTVLDNLSTGKRENIHDNATFIKGSILNTGVLEEAIEGCSAVFHLAALVSVGECNNNPLKAHQTNVTGSLNVLEACRKADVNNAVFASSAAVYGDNGREIQSEDAPTLPTSIYGSTKLAAEQYFKTYSRLYGIDATCLRYFNVYGPRQSFQGDEVAVIPSFIKKALNDNNLTIYGDGKHTRDFIYIDDVVEITIKSMENSTASIINLGSGKKTSIRELAEKVKDLSGREIKIIYDNHREGDIKHSRADVTKMQNLLLSTKTPLKKGLKQTYRWIKQEEK